MNLTKLLPCAALMAASLSHGEPAPVNVRAELDRPVVNADQTERVVIKITLEPGAMLRERERPPVNLALVLDRSGSMGGAKIAQAREAALEALSLLGPRDRIALVAYDDEASTLICTQHPQEREHLARIIRGLRAGGSTALYAGVSQSAAEVRRGVSDGSINRIVLLSDGQANVGPSSVEDLRGLGRSLAGEDITVSTVGLGTGFNEDLMTGLAETGQGNSYFAENARDLARIFAAELDDALSVTATDVRVSIQFAPGVRPVAFIGREGEISGQQASFSINQLMGGHEKFALVEVEVPAGESGKSRELARVHVDYAEAATGAAHQRKTQARLSYSDSTEDIKAAANVEVARALVENRLAEAKREAISLSDRGQHAQAAQRMRRLNVEISTINADYADAEMAQEAAAVLDEAEELGHERMSNRKRKSYLNSSYQSVNQQSTRD